MADPVAAVSLVGIAQILPVRKAVFREILLDLPPRDAQQRAHDPPPLGRDTAETAQAAAAREVHEDRFGVVVGVMGGGDPVAAEDVGRPLQKGVAQLSGRRLDAEALLRRAGRHIAVPHRAGDAALAAEGHHKACVREGFLPAKAVLKVGGENR